VQLGRLATNSVVSMLIVYALICVSYLRFYVCIDKATTGQIQSLNYTAQDLQAYNRHNRHYPFKSRGQWLKACYGILGCALLAFFNGWRSFVTPFSSADFIASYISIPVFCCIVAAYHVKLDGWNPKQWSFRNSRELLQPPPEVVLREDRVGSLRLPNSTKLFSRENALPFLKWVWAWLK